MWFLALLVACGTPNAPAPEAPAAGAPSAGEVEGGAAAASAPEADPCLEACLERRKVEAVDIELVCRLECEGPAPVTTRERLAMMSGQRAKIEGTLVRRPIGEGDAKGTAVLLSDGTAVWLSYGDPPHGWEGLVGNRVVVEGNLWDGPPRDVDRTGVWREEPHLTAYDAPMPTL